MNKINPFSNIIFLFFIISFLLFACKRNSDEYIPNVPVNITIYPSNPQYFKLTTVGGWMYISGGVRGIIVYRNSINDFSAYDRNCSYQPQNACSTVNVDSSNNIYAFCPCCSSQFVLTDGSVAKGPANFPLKSYRTFFDGNALQISN
jgi:nitrite reductase/ring-hydroxylating ferredoxin subunit